MSDASKITEVKQLNYFLTYQTYQTFHTLEVKRKVKTERPILEKNNIWWLSDHEVSPKWCEQAGKKLYKVAFHGGWILDDWGWGWILLIRLLSHCDVIDVEVLRLALLVRPCQLRGGL